MSNDGVLLVFRRNLSLGFGSTSKHIIDEHAVHYDCGCILSEKGELLRYSKTGQASGLNVPAVYTAYFSTFGALVSRFSISSVYLISSLLSS